MNSKKRNRVCPVSLAGTLDSGLRRLLQNPRRVIEPLVNEGMRVLEFGCGPGFFTVEIARNVGESGSVIAADLQDGMLDILAEKIRGTDIEDRVTLHKSGERSVGVSQKVDLVFAFYVMHELSESSAFLREFQSVLAPHGRLYIAEPKAHVSKREFRDIIKRAEDSGFSLVSTSTRLMTRTAIFDATVPGI
jgi:ubiquinone/menaquinone biosynthesis C-methylase UbiE